MQAKTFNARSAMLLKTHAVHLLGAYVDVWQAQTGSKTFHIGCTCHVFVHPYQIWACMIDMSAQYELLALQHVHKICKSFYPVRSAQSSTSKFCSQFEIVRLQSTNCLHIQGKGPACRPSSQDSDLSTTWGKQAGPSLDTADCHCMGGGKLQLGTR